MLRSCFQPPAYTFRKNGGEGLSVRTCVVNVHAQSTRIKEIESSFELKQKQDAKRSDLQLDTRFKLKQACLQKYNPIQPRLVQQNQILKITQFLFINFIHLGKFSICCLLR